MTNDTTSYIQFGKLEGKKKTIYDIRYGQEAYEFEMVPRYFKDIMAYHENNISLLHKIEDITDNIKKYVALGLFETVKPIYYEVGSSLMGVIDALVYLNKRYISLGKELICIEKILFIGVDNSKIMNFGAKALHPSYQIVTTERIKPFACDVFFAKGISLLYAFEDEALFCEVLKNSRIAIFDYTFSKKGQIYETIGTGKPVVYLNLDKCKKLLKHKDKELVLKKSTRDYAKDNDQRVTYECIYGEKELIDKYQKELRTLI